MKALRLMNNNKLISDKFYEDKEFSALAYDALTWCIDNNDDVYSNYEKSNCDVYIEYQGKQFSATGAVEILALAEEFSHRGDRHFCVLEDSDILDFIADELKDFHTHTIETYGNNILIINEHNNFVAAVFIGEAQIKLAQQHCYIKRIGFSLKEAIRDLVPLM